MAEWNVLFCKIMTLLTNLKEKKKLFFKRQNIFYLLIIFIIFFLDRYSKTTVLKNFDEKSYYINNFINFDLIWNTGIGFGLMRFDSTLIYNFITFLVCSVIIILLIVALSFKTIDKLFFTLIIGGALGNFYDRLIFKAVPDFIDLHYNSFHWFTFNVADIFITIGIIGYLFNGTLRT